ncbi:ATP synthase subunit d, mitochondrial [Olea europaea subsp. europaea]|uniref:ATP synthase subunit d, mitochondrial n=1 Tax=Olea europaea subsp. europaea TaxID=158383 RepID=A0A8S0SFI9_OLEEU|nr:ATP synthase subunit d, mitochondrial [Olea europaea subsp. europaea]
MSGAGKKIADVAFKAGKTIDWEGMAKLLVSDEARKEFATLRRAFDEVNTQLQTKFSQEPEPIDWEYYRKGIGSRLVDIYKQAYDGMCHMLLLVFYSKKSAKSLPDQGFCVLSTRLFSSFDVLSIPC